MANSEELLKDTVFQLLGHHQNYDNTFQEILSLKETCGNPSAVESLTNWGWFTLTSSGDQTVSSNVSHTVDVCKRRLLSLSSCDTFRPEHEGELQLLVRILQQLKQSGASKSGHFTKLLAECPNLPLQVIWTLHTEGIFSLESYLLMSLGKKSSLEHFVLKLSTIEEEKLPVLTSEIVSEMLVIAFSGEHTASNHSKKTMLEVVDRIVLGFVDKAVEGTITRSDSMLEFNMCLDLETKKKVCTHLLTTILCHLPVMKVSQAIREQAKWSYGKISPALTHLYKQFLLAFDVTETLTLIREILEQQEVNWQLILSLISEVVVCMPESSKLFLDFIDELLGEGLDNSEFETTIMGMLLARQACFQGPHVFLSYNDWFQRTFTDSSRSLASSRKSFTFLMKFLTNLVPYESADHIKVHILRPPFAPSKCRQILTDYITLAKTRLADLKESLDIQAEECDHSTGKNNSLISLEVENAVKLFETTRKVPTSVLESSIFRKPYYIGQFLPALLRPRPLPDFPDSRMGLIEALRRADKVPMSMYNIYQKGCKKEASQLLEGVFIDSDSDCDMELSPMEQLDVTLQQFVLTVKAECLSEKTKHSMSEIISLLCERLENISMAKQDSPAPALHSISLDAQTVTMDSIQIKIVDKLLNSIAQSIHECYKTSNPVFTWVSGLLSSICMFSSLPENLYKRIWTLLINQGTSLESHHIDCLSVLLVEVQLLNERLPLVTDCVATSETVSRKTLTERIVDALSLQTSQWMNFGLKFFGSCLKYIFSTHENIEQCLILPGIIKKFTYLATRLHPQLRYLSNNVDSTSETEDIVSALYTSDIFQKLSDVFPMTVEEWVGYEIMVCPDKDLLADFQRHEYFSWIVYRYFVSRQTTNQNVYCDLASCIVKEILHTDSCAARPDACCSKCAVKQPSAKLTHSRSVMVHLLYEMTQMFVCPDQGRQLSGMLPWLPQQLEDIKKSSSSEINQHCLIQHFFQLCLSLPPYLMFTNSLHISVSMETVLGVIDFINSTVRLHVCEGIYLPARLIAYFLQGVAQIRNVHSTTDLTERLLQQCPLIFVSILMNADIVRPLILQLTGKDNNLLQIVDCIRDASYSGVQDPWQLSVILFSKIMNTASGEVPSILNDLTTVSSDVPVQKQVCCNLVQMLLLQLTYIQEFREPKDHCAEDRIMKFLSEMLKRADKEDFSGMFFKSDLDYKIAMCSHENLIKMKYLTSLKFLKDRQTFNGHALCSSFLTGVLKALTDCHNMFDKSEVLPQIHPWSGNELNGLNEFVVSLIAATDRTVLCDVDQELLLQAGPTIADCAIRIMSS